MACQLTHSTAFLGHLVQNAFRVVVIVVELAPRRRKLDVVVPELQFQKTVGLKLIRVYHPRVIQPVSLNNSRGRLDDEDQVSRSTHKRKS